METAFPILDHPTLPASTLSSLSASSPPPPLLLCVAFCVTPLMDIDQRALEERRRKNATRGQQPHSGLFLFSLFFIWRTETARWRCLLMGVNLAVPQRSRVWYHSRGPGFHLMWLSRVTRKAGLLDCSDADVFSSTGGVADWHACLHRSCHSLRINYGIDTPAYGLIGYMCPMCSIIYDPLSFGSHIKQWYCHSGQWKKKQQHAQSGVDSSHEKT